MSEQPPAPGPQTPGAPEADIAPTAPGAAAAPGRHRLHVLTPLFDLMSAARQFWFLFLPLLRPGADRSDLLFVVLISALVAWKIAGWFFVSYELGPEAIVYRSGILQREERTMPYERIQQVSVNQNVRQRLVAVARLSVAPASGESIRLEVLSNRAARQLQQAIEDRRRIHQPPDLGSATVGPPAAATAEGDAAPGASAAQPTGTPQPEGPELLRLGVADLALAGVTGARLLVVLGAGFAVINAVDDLPMVELGPQSFEGTSLPAATAATVAIGVLTAGVLWFGLAALASVVTEFGFTLRRGGDRFWVTKGLLARSEVAIPADRIQSVAFHQSILRRWLQRTLMRVRSAAGGFVVPLVPELVAVDLLDPLVGASRLPDLQPAPPAARRRAIVRRVVPALAIALPAAVLAGPWGLASLALVPLAALAGWAAWRGMAHGADSTLLVARSGALYRSHSIVPVDKAQSTRVTSSWFQRRVGLATLHVDTAGGGSARVPDIHAARAGELAEALVSPTPARTADDRRSRSGARPRG